MNKLTRQCLALPREQREKLIRTLQESVKDEGSGNRRFDVLVDIATKVVGNGILSKSRDFNCVIGRRMIAYQMRKEGCTLLRVARHMKVHHASVVHMEKMMKDVLDYPDCFRLEKAYWDEFSKKVEDYDIHNRTTQGS